VEALARYRYLTVGQLGTLGLRDAKGVRAWLHDLWRAKIIHRQEFRGGVEEGRLPNAHWLTPKGAKLFLEATGEDVKAPAGGLVSFRHVWHRMLTVDAFIAADQWADATGQARPQLASYMTARPGAEPTGFVMPDGTRAVADGILRMADTAGNRRVYVVEAYCSRHGGGRSTYPRAKLEGYVLAGRSDAFDTALGIGHDERAALVLVVCDTPALKDRLLRTLPERPGLPPLAARQGTSTWARLLFKSADELSDFGRSWARVDGSVADLPS
jgi:hypothetical protein